MMRILVAAAAVLFSLSWSIEQVQGVLCLDCNRNCSQREICETSGFCYISPVDDHLERGCIQIESFSLGFSRHVPPCLFSPHTFVSLPCFCKTDLCNAVILPDNARDGGGGGRLLNDIQLFEDVYRENQGRAGEEGAAPIPHPTEDMQSAQTVPVSTNTNPNTNPNPSSFLERAPRPSLTDEERLANFLHRLDVASTTQATVEGGAASLSSTDLVDEQALDEAVRATTNSRPSGRVRSTQDTSFLDTDPRPGTTREERLAYYFRRLEVNDNDNSTEISSAPATGTTGGRESTSTNYNLVDRDALNEAVAIALRTVNTRRPQFDVSHFPSLINIEACGPGFPMSALSFLVPEYEGLCPDEFEYYDTYKCCYKIIRESMSPPDALKFCQGLHPRAALSSLDSFDEYTCVVNRLAKEAELLDGWQGWWTSGSWNESIREFTWVPHSSHDDSSHVISRRDNRWMENLLVHPYNETCVWLLPQTNFLFGNYWCRQKSGFICEIVL